MLNSMEDELHDTPVSLDGWWHRIQDCWRWSMLVLLVSVMGGGMWLTRGCPQISDAIDWASGCRSADMGVLVGFHRQWV